MTVRQRRGPQPGKERRPPRADCRIRRRETAPAPSPSNVNRGVDVLTVGDVDVGVQQVGDPWRACAALTNPSPPCLHRDVTAVGDHLPCRSCQAPRSPAVVVAVRGAQDGVDVERLGGVVVEEHAAVMVEFGDDDRAIGCGSRRRRPAGGRRSSRTRSRRGASRISAHPCRTGTRWQGLHELPDDVEHAAVAPPRACHATRMPSNGMTRLSWKAPARWRSSPGWTRPSRHRWIDHLLVDRSRAALLVGQGSHQRRAQPIRSVEGRRYRRGARIDLVGFGTEEHRAEHHAPFDDEAVHRAVVAVELPTPRRVQVRFAVERDVVAELVENALESDDLAEEAVDQHHVVRQFVAFGAE